MTGPSDPEGRPFEPMPSAPSLDEQQAAPVAAARPGSVTVAFALWLVIGVIMLISAVLVMVVSTADLEDVIRRGLEQRGQHPSDQDVRSLAQFSRIIGIGLNLVFAALLLSFAFVMRGGKNWARIAVLVVGGLYVVLGLLGIGSNIIIALIELLIVLIAAFFMFRPDANRFFAASRTRA